MRSTLLAQLGDSIALARAAERAGISMTQARRLVAELAAMPLDRLVRVVMGAR